MKFVINNLSDVPEAVQSEYEAKNGKFYLKIEGDIPAVIEANAKVVEFRNKNIDLLKEVDDLRPLKTKFEGLDADAAREAIKKVAELGKKGVKDADDLDARVKAMVDEVVKPLRDTITASAAETAAERARANDFLLHSKISEAFAKADGKPQAIDFVVNLAKEVFEVNDRGISAKTGKFSTEKPGDPISVNEWLGGLAKEHDYVFTPSNGGGAPIIKAGAPGSKVVAKPGQTILKNPTPQELGQYSADIASGKVKVDYDTKTTH